MQCLAQPNATSSEWDLTNTAPPPPPPDIFCHSTPTVPVLACLCSCFPRIQVMADSNHGGAAAKEAVELSYVQYEGTQEEQYLPSIRQLIGKDLSEPYSIYVYRYFLYQWSDLCFMVRRRRNK
jgi:hypothetical protein